MVEKRDGIRPKKRRGEGREGGGEEGGRGGMREGKRKAERRKEDVDKSQTVDGRREGEPGPEA